MTAANHRRSVFLGLLLVTAGSLAGLVLSELGYRVARRYFVCLPGNPNLFVARSWGWTHAPGMSLRMHGCIGRRFEWRSHVAINTKGLRDSEVAYARTSAPRVLVLGDSITEGVQVDVEDTFVERAERILAEELPGMEVINGGHAGFGNDNELAFYRAEGRRYAPDLVLLAFNIQNDILENSASLYHRAYAEAREQFAPKPTFDVTAEGALLELPAPPARAPTSQAAPAAWRRFLSYFYVLRLLSRSGAAGDGAGGFGYPINFEVYAPFDPEWTHAWRITVALLRQLRAEVEADGARFAVLLVPTKEMVSPADFERALRFFGVTRRDFDLEQPRRLTTELFAAEDIPYLDVQPLLRAHAAATGKTGFFDLDVHLDRGGHGAIAPALADFLRTQLRASRFR